MSNKNIDVGKKMKIIFKNKKINNEQKVSQLIKEFSVYYKSKLANDVVLCTYELYYERFMIDEKHRHDLVYNKYYQFEYKNLIYLYAVTLNHYFMKLNGKVNLNLLPNDEQTIFKNVLSFTQNCNFNKGFDYTTFYTNESIRDRICTHLTVFEDDIKSYLKKDKSLYEF